MTNMDSANSSTHLKKKKKVFIYTSRARVISTRTDIQSASTRKQYSNLYQNEQYGSSTSFTIK